MEWQQELERLQRRVEKLETKPKDRWDKVVATSSFLQAIAAFLVPIAVVLAGASISAAWKEAELAAQIQRDAAAQSLSRDRVEVEKTRSEIEHARVAGELAAAIAQADAGKQYIIVKIVEGTLPRVDIGSILQKIADDTSIDADVRDGARAAAGKLRKPQIEILLDRIRVVKDCDPGTHLDGEFFYTLRLNGKVAARIPRDQAIDASDEDEILINEIVRTKRGEEQATVQGQLFERDENFEDVPDDILSAEPQVVRLGSIGPGDYQFQMAFNGNRDECLAKLYFTARRRD